MPNLRGSSTRCPNRFSFMHCLPITITNLVAIQGGGLEYCTLLHFERIILFWFQSRIKSREQNTKYTPNIQKIYL